MGRTTSVFLVLIDLATIATLTYIYIGHSNSKMDYQVSPRPKKEPIFSLKSISSKKYCRTRVRLKNIDTTCPLFTLKFSRELKVGKLKYSSN